MGSSKKRQSVICQNRFSVLSSLANNTHLDRIDEEGLNKQENSMKSTSSRQLEDDILKEENNKTSNKSLLKKIIPDFSSKNRDLTLSQPCFVGQLNESPSYQGKVIQLPDSSGESSSEQSISFKSKASMSIRMTKGETDLYFGKDYFMKLRES